MRNQKLYESVGKYIDKYYIDKPDDIKLDKDCLLYTSDAADE